MGLTEATETEVYKIISNLKTTKRSTDYYGFSNKFLKTVNPVVTPTLTKHLNRMIFEKTVPPSMKVSKVIPLFKNGTRQDPRNYRPIAITPFFSKVLEKILENRILKFFDKYNVLNTNQYGFRAKRKTVDAILELTEYVRKSTNSGDGKLEATFFDISKAFDTLSHTILSNKCLRYGMRGPVFDLLKSYLQDRKQFVDLNKTSFHCSQTALASLKDQFSARY